MRFSKSPFANEIQKKGVEKELSRLLHCSRGVNSCCVTSEWWRPDVDPGLRFIEVRAVPVRKVGDVLLEKQREKKNHESRNALKFAGNRKKA